MPTHSTEVWLGFTALVATLLILDLGVLNRRSHTLSIREASLWSGTLVLIAGLFGAFLWWREGSQTGIEFYTGYLVELSLSVDNLFVFILIFQYFAVPPALQPRVLKWGILGAIVMRAIMIALGTVLLTRFHWPLTLSTRVTGPVWFAADPCASAPACARNRQRHCRVCPTTPWSPPCPSVI